MDKFFILGLPRSRTYWLSQFLGCMHEGLYYYPDYRLFMESEHIGDSTTCYTGIKDYITNYKKVIIHRKEEEVIASLTHVFGENDYSFIENDALILKEEQGLHVMFNDINERLPEIWRFCRNESYDIDRSNELIRKRLENKFMISETMRIIHANQGSPQDSAK
ncbi:MAG: hypothetical protein GXP22_06695 [Gammaproteobacteria bacterium]|nr:hypothetical protein [Gammaproteobacteria bacterium]